MYLLQMLLLFHTMGADHEKQGGYDTQTISPWYYKFGINF